MGRRSRSRTGLLDVRWMPRPAKQLQAGAAAAASGHLAPDLDFEGCPDRSPRSSPPAQPARPSSTKPAPAAPSPRTTTTTNPRHPDHRVTACPPKPRPNPFGRGFFTPEPASPAMTPHVQDQRRATPVLHRRLRLRSRPGATGPVPRRRGGLRVGRPGRSAAGRTGRGATRPDRVLATVPKAVWERRSCGAGTKGARCYDWAAVAVTVKDQAPRRRARPHAADPPLGQRPQRPPTPRSRS